MKTIGLIGGLSWVSTLDYYRIINEQTNLRLGDDEAARLVLYSVNFGEIKELTLNGKWEKISVIMCDAAKKLEKSGAACVLLGANTMHNVAGSVEDAIGVPLIHIADATAMEIRRKGLSKVALLGTRYTMQMDFYKKKMLDHNIETLIPDSHGIELVNNAIYDELGKGIFMEGTKQAFLKLIDQLSDQGAQGVILGCTDIPMLINQGDCRVPLFDTTFLHAEAAVNFALN